ncbi:MAG: hypothetical protein MUD14_10810 [Hydrococcus sp. Prado102]|jgi:hypothetical protein|nr:hypothetical protein [Hydrococcus sp. Prado102]
MKKFFILRQSFVQFCTILFLALIVSIGIQIIHPHPIVAQSDTALRSEVTSLRSRVSRLEAEIRSVGRSGTRPITPSEPRQITPPQEVNGVAVGSSDPMFERLATLAIELKERVTSLEKRVTQIEQKT